MMLGIFPGGGTSVGPRFLEANHAGLRGYPTEIVEVYSPELFGYLPMHQPYRAKLIPFISLKKV